MVYDRAGLYSPNCLCQRGELSIMLIYSGIDCYINNVCAYSVFYADNLCLKAPCAKLFKSC